MTTAKPSTKSYRNSRNRKKSPKKLNQTSNCNGEPGNFIPIVNAQRCEGKGACAAVCPYDVFEIKRMPDDQFSTMPFFVKVKLWIHGRKTAFTPNMDDCLACGACVSACPEHAIILSRVEPPLIDS
jgi:4Fe-4S ferredoxin